MGLSQARTSAARPCLRRGNFRASGVSDSNQSGWATSKLLSAGDPPNNAVRMRACSAEAFSKAAPALVAASTSKKCLARGGSALAFMAFAQSGFFISLKACLENPLHCRSRRKEAQILAFLEGLSVNQSLLTSAPTFLEYALARHRLQNYRRRRALFGRFK